MAEDNNKKQTSLRGGMTRQSASLEHATDRLPHSAGNDEHKTSLRGGTTKQSAQSKTLPLLPELRFKEFDGEWNSNLLGKFSSKIGSGSTPTGGNQVYQDSGIPFIRSQNVFDDKLFLDGTHISKILHLKMKGSTVKPNDILLNITGGSIGRSCVVPKDFNEGNVNQHVCIIRLKDNFNANFIQSFLSSHKGQKLIYEGQTGSGREGINFQSIRLFKINIPTLPEQQKIASFLSAVDEKIQQLSKKKTLLEQYKKGVMQQLFSGEFRFKDENGEDFPDWEEKRLGSLGSFKGGGTPTTETDDYWNGSTPWISSSDISENNIDSIQTSRFITEKAIQESATKLIPVSSVLFVARVGVGKLAVNNRPLCTSQDFVNFTPTDSHPYYLAYYFLQNRKVLHRYSQGTSIKGFTSVDLKSVKIKIPSIQEQQKIADYLSAIDSKIEIVNQQIEKTQSFKKGLLQQMFV